MSELIVDYVSPDRLDDAPEGERRRPAMPPMGISLLKAMTPDVLEGHGITARCWDEMTMGRYDVAVQRPDILCLSALTTAAARAYRLADEAKQVIGAAGARIMTAMGGIHATALPREALSHVDAVAVGETAPSTLKALLAWLLQHRSSAGNERQAFRHPASANIVEERPLPDWSWLPHKGYLGNWSMQTSVGCPFNCSFCSVTYVYGSTHRPVAYDLIEREAIRVGRNGLGGTGVVVDDNFLPNKNGEHARRVCEIFRRHGVKWLTELTAMTLYNNQDELIPLFARSGCKGLYIGVESITGGLGKSMETSRYEELIRRCHDNDIAVLGAFVFGVDDSERPDVFERTAEWGVKAKLDLAQYSINTPEPGARDFEAAVRGNLITDWNWENYDAAHPVRRFPHISQEQMYHGLRDAFGWFYSASSAWRRLSPSIVDSVKWRYWHRSLLMGALNKYLSVTQKRWNLRSVYGEYVGRRIERPNALVQEQFTPDMPHEQYDTKTRNRVLAGLIPDPLEQVIPDVGVTAA
ncbi:MAG TPA: radical SAM protein [Armatimonadota bacterium]|jgi:radical SAM superfamily enzyme YgiQ (UPF0313 family)